MSLFLTLIILFFVWSFIIWPFIKLVKISRRWRDAFTPPRSNGRQQQRQRAEPQRPKKKIDPTVGEYVEFTETIVTSASEPSDNDAATDTIVESQITDVTWEDIPEK